MPATHLAALEQEARAHDDDLRVINLCLDLVLYTSSDFSAIPKQIQHGYQRLLAMIPAGRLAWYAHAGSTRHRPLTHRTLGIVPGWFAAGAAHRSDGIRHIHLKDGASYADAAGYSLWLWGDEPGRVGYGHDSNVIRLTLPASDGSCEQIRDLMLELAAAIPCDCGHAGLVVETTGYKQEASERAAFAMSMRHPGLDIANPITDSVALRREAVKGVNWLTLLSAEMLARLDPVNLQAARAEPELTFHSVAGGSVLIQAGPSPVADDGPGRAPAPYRAVWRLIAPLQALLLDHYGAFDLPGGNHRQLTREWLLRCSRA